MLCIPQIGGHRAGRLPRTHCGACLNFSLRVRFSRPSDRGLSFAELAILALTSAFRSVPFGANLSKEDARCVPTKNPHVGEIRTRGILL